MTLLSAAQIQRFCGTGYNFYISPDGGQYITKAENATRFSGQLDAGAIAINSRSDRHKRDGQGHSYVLYCKDSLVLHHVERKLHTCASDGLTHTHCC